MDKKKPRGRPKKLPDNVVEFKKKEQKIDLSYDQKLSLNIVENDVDLMSMAKQFKLSNVEMADILLAVSSHSEKQYNLNEDWFNKWDAKPVYHGILFQILISHACQVLQEIQPIIDKQSYDKFLSLALRSLLENEKE